MSGSRHYNRSFHFHHWYLDLATTWTISPINLEISINSEVKRYSSIRSLIHRTVQVASPNLPLHFTEFINANISMSDVELFVFTWKLLK